MHWYAEAPANIALIKYMGKRNAQTNHPLNSSLSYTLDHFTTAIHLEESDTEHDTWQPLLDSTRPILHLPPQAVQRFLKHLQFIKQQFNCNTSFTVSSGNNFPHGAGLASSASSFAALTRAASMACAQLTQTPCPDSQTQAAWSQQGSGSSCRSFFSPWALWQAERVSPITLPYTELLHQVILLDSTTKAVSSSSAHERVQTSPNMTGRHHRAEENLQALLKALTLQRWDEAYQLCWDEFQDMHTLFHTAVPSFTYYTPESQQVLMELQDLWKSSGDGPLITMDAGANIHLLYRPEQHALRESIKQHYQERCHVV
jgi:diphosphomevalonate decarboxylase